MEKTSIVKIVFRIVFALGTLAGIIANIVFQGNLVRALSYYTLQSNLFVLIMVIALLLFPGMKPKLLKRLKFIMTSGILITFFVYHLILYPSFVATGDFEFPFWYDFPVHTFAPLMMLADFLLFDRENEIKGIQIAFCLVMPAFYLLYSQLYALLGGTFTNGENVSKYAYFFLDPDTIGSGFVLLSIVIISVFAGILGWFLSILDKKLPVLKAR